MLPLPKDKGSKCRGDVSTGDRGSPAEYKQKKKKDVGVGGLHQRRRKNAGISRLLAENFG
jgi:hypothetical protein